MWSRRSFLTRSGLALAATAAAPGFLCRAAALEGKRPKTLVALFLRGAADGLNVVVPSFDEAYSSLRPNLAIPRAGSGAALDLDGSFGLHPALRSLTGLWNDKALAAIQATGSPDPTRSHFDAQDYMESATPGRKGVTDGWLNRFMTLEQVPEESPLRAVAIATKPPRALQGSAPATVLPNVNRFRLAAGAPQVAKAFGALYGEQPTAELNRSGRNALESLRLIEDIQKTAYQPANGARYPRGRFGDKMLQIAQLLKADVGLEIAFADGGGWDSHTNQEQQIEPLLRDLGDSLAAFAQDLGSRMEDVLVLTMSEFGRTAAENGNRGTDHGHGNCMFVLGGGVRGGQVYGDWPGLGPDQLYQRRDLAVTTDFRDIFAEALVGHFGADRIDAVFPGYQPQKTLGFLRSA
ncbi:MAG: DUF1501 domain-containing protein [Acidobacteria bacterium]|nr:DUF1501 domain-containing protein [Acidobacteriota bacterium]